MTSSRKKRDQADTERSTHINKYNRPGTGKPEKAQASKRSKEKERMIQESGYQIVNRWGRRYETRIVGVRMHGVGYWMPPWAVLVG